ncbi:MAG: LytTR family DNA-binding domain-containing protein [Bacteroidota bacterium]
MLISAVIIDDEQNNIENLEILLEQYCPQLTVVATALNATDGKSIILEHDPDIVFLDIQMPGKNGFALLQSLQTHNFELIFVTAFDQYGIQAVKFSALDYLLKPINTEELKTAVHKAIYRSSEKKQNKKLENLLQVLEHQQQKNLHRIALTSAKETRFIRTQDIIRCESSNNYTTFFLFGREKIMTSKPIFEYEEILVNYGFIRCHQSHLVNKKHIKSWVKEDGGFLLLDDNTQVPISRQKKEYVKMELEKD